MSDAPPEVSRDIIAAATLPVDPTGVPNLDPVLGGGLPRGALALVVGPPGGGKTTLAGQMAFAAARAGRRVLLLTALSEPASKLLAHLRTFTFYDEDLLGGRVQVVSLQQFLPEGLARISDELLAMARAQRASLVVLDGFSGLREVDSDPQAARAFLYDTGGTLSVGGATTIITRETDLRDRSFSPEGTVADVIVALHASRDDVRLRRGLEVIKVRGAAPLPGLHGLVLNATGAVVYPRLEARVVRAAQDDAHAEPPARATPVAGGAPDERATFNLPECDMLLGGGLTRQTSTLVVGSPGAGKTLLALHFALAGLRAGEAVLFLGFHETQRELVLKADAFRLGPELRAALAPGGRLTLLREPPVELDADVLADDLLTALDQTGARRLVVDSIAEVERAASEAGEGRRVPSYLAALVAALQGRGVTTLFTKENDTVAAAELALSADLISVVAANVVWLQQVAYRGRLRRVLSVPKMRFSAHDDTLREFTIAAPAGITVLRPFESDPAMLTDIAAQQAARASGALRGEAPGQETP
jgi:circadian clock protein KaiC